jgi:hypothetical protein
MHFIHQPLTWGFFLVLLPLLIHLINMLRHRRVKWAAMEFLLQAYKKHRKWIWLKQLLLLLMRMVAVALLVAMLAQWVTRGQWLDFLGGKATHHYVLLDDSYSMSDRAGGTSAFETALTAIQRIAAQAAAQDTPQKFTLIRFSRAGREPLDREQGANLERATDFNAEAVDPHFDVTLTNKRNTFQVTQLATGPLPALAVLEQLFDQAADEHRVVYLVSDFRTVQWDNPAEIRDRLKRIEQSPAEIHLVGCVKETRPNLGLVELQPAQETRAAGVPLFVTVAVKNFSGEAARNVQLKINTVFCDPEVEQAAAPDKFAGKGEELPTILIETIDPGQTVIRRVQVFFPKPGRHVVEATLPDDPVAADNHRWCVIDVPDHESVLVIDGSPQQRHAFFLQAIFQPGGRAKTGIQPQVNAEAFLRDTSPETLRQFQAIYLLDVPRLDDRAVENLEAYVRNGGGVAFFVGPDVTVSFYNNRLYRGGQGLFPLPLGREDVLLAEDAEHAPDIEVTEHPVFNVFLGERNSFIQHVTIERFLRPQDGWKPDPDSTVVVAASLRNRLPLAVERKFGEGRVLAFLTTLAPDWNNWANDPSFVVTALRLHSHLAAQQRASEARAVGVPITLQLEADKFRQDLQIITPGETAEIKHVIDRVATKREPNSPVLTVTVGEVAADGTGETDLSGIYEAWPVTTAGEPDVRRFAVNVESSEGDLTRVEPKTLLTSLNPIKAEFRYADEYSYELSGFTGNNRSLLLMCLLLLLLLGEQALAYSASYHPAKPAAG